MSIASRFWAVLALPLAFAGNVQAGIGPTEAASEEAGLEFALPVEPFAFGIESRRDTSGGVLVAQAADPRITALEEQVRQLTGRIEELNFLILQMQDDVRKTQEDNEFRFQQIEEKRSDAGGRQDRPPRATAGADDAPRGALPTELGTITFDANGNPTGAGRPPAEAEDRLPGVETGPVAPQAAESDDGATDDTVVAALPPTDNPDELYRNAYNFILSGDYATAEAGFREHIERFPEDAQAADAHYWLGEALLGMEQYRSAAEIFLAANKEFPNSRKAPDMLLKLGVSLAAIKQRDVACATYAEIGKRYKDASAALKERVRQEQALAGC